MTAVNRQNNNLSANILIVDDEVDICFLLKGILGKKNFDASYVTTLSSGNEYLTSNKPDLIFLDNHLPDGRGMDYISKFKSMVPGVKIIMITAHDTSADREKAYGEGVDDFISKPFSRDTILHTVQKMLAVE